MYESQPEVNIWQQCISLSKLYKAVYASLTKALLSFPQLRISSSFKIPISIMMVIGYNSKYALSSPTTAQFSLSLYPDITFRPTISVSYVTLLSYIVHILLLSYSLLSLSSSSFSPLSLLCPSRSSRSSNLVLFQGHAYKTPVQAAATIPGRRLLHAWFIKRRKKTNQGEQEVQNTNVL